MPAWAEVSGNRPIHRTKLLRVPRRFKPLHVLFPLARGLVRVLRTIIQIVLLSVLDPRQNLALRCTIAFEFIGDDHPGDVLAPFMEYVAVLIHCPPQIMTLLIDCDEHFIQMPLVARPEAATAQRIGILRVEHVHSSVKRCRIAKDRLRLWKESVCDRVMEICCALHNLRVRMTPWQPMV
jgi:hypothetical protein